MLFVFAYVATFVALASLGNVFQHHVLQQWTALASVTTATALVVFAWERGRWQLGFFVAPRHLIRELILGLLFACGVILVGDLVIMAASDLRHRPGNGFPWNELAAVFLPAVLHEELLFRGYPYQKLRRWGAGWAMFLTSLFFAALHLGNHSVTWLGIANIFLAGYLLGLAYECYGRLWFPIGIHLMWNLLSGPILGYEVSGYVPEATVLVTRSTSAAWITGGPFGIEGSVVMTVVEIAAILALSRVNAKCRMQNAEGRM